MLLFRRAKIQAKSVSGTKSVSAECQVCPDNAVLYFIEVMLSPLKCIVPSGSGCSDQFCFSLGRATPFVRHEQTKLGFLCSICSLHW